MFLNCKQAANIMGKQLVMWMYEHRKPVEVKTMD